LPGDTELTKLSTSFVEGGLVVRLGLALTDQSRLARSGICAAIAMGKAEANRITAARKTVLRAATK